MLKTQKVAVTSPHNAFTESLTQISEHYSKIKIALVAYFQQTLKKYSCKLNNTLDESQNYDCFFWVK
jgi:hypothetical protein